MKLKQTDKQAMQTARSLDEAVVKISRVDYRGLSNGAALTRRCAIARANKPDTMFDQLIAFGFAQLDGSYIWKWIHADFLEKFQNAS